MKKLLIFLLSIIILCYTDIPSMASEEPDPNELFAKAAVLMDADSGRILYAKNENEQMPMASTTKILTLIVTLENRNLDEKVTVSEYAASMPDVQLNIRKGETYYLGDLLYSLMLESHNDSAVAIAEHVSGSIEKFAELMNKKAKEIGCGNSFFITPNGLDATATVNSTDGTNKEVTHSTTAGDLARIMSYCIMDSPQKEMFLKITGTGNYTFSDIDGTRHFSCNNHNAFLGMMDGALSGKTGFTSKAGYCYVGALRRDNRTYVVALLACGWPGNKTYKWKDTKKLMTYGIENYTYHLFEEAGVLNKPIEPVAVLQAQSNKIGEKVYILPILTEMGDETGILMKEEEKLQTVSNIKNELNAPVKKNTKIGSIKLTLNNQMVKEYCLYTNKDIDRIDYRWCFDMVMKYFTQTTKRD